MAKIQIRTRNEQHQKYATKKQWENSGAAAHSGKCDGILWDETETVKIEKNKFDRKVREALEIQRHKCGPTAGGMNIDIGSYVRTQFWTPFFKYHRKVTSVTANVTSNTNDDTIV